MQKLYKIEIFDNAFNLVGHSAILEPEVVYDYISMSTTSIACLDEMPNIRQYQLAHITDNDGTVVFQGIVYGFVQEKDALMQVTVKPLLSLMDRSFSTEGYITEYDTVEGWIAYFLKTVYQGTEQIPASYAGIKIRAVTQTRIAEARDPEMAAIMDMYDYAVTALQAYGIVVKAAFDPQAKTFTFEIGVNSDAQVTVEADRPNIIAKTFNMDGDGEKYNVVQLFFKDDTGQTTGRWYALNTEGGLADTTPPDYHLEDIEPPLMMTYADLGSGYNTTDKYPPDSVWLEKAREVLKPAADSQEISLTVSAEDRLVRIDMMDMGRAIRILHAGSVYESKMTGVLLSNGVKTLTFGFARTDLTSILTFQRRGKTW